MEFRTVLVVTGAGHSDRDVKTGIALCEEIGAHLAVEVLALAAPPPIGEYAAVVSDAWFEERQRDVETLKARVQAVNIVLAAQGISADVSSEYAEMAWASDIVGRRGRYADVTVIGPELAADGVLLSHVENGALFESARPLVIVPEGAVATLRPKRVVVAWNAGIEAARAVGDALEILRHAEAVHVTLVDPESYAYGNGPEPGADVAAYLARHGVKVSVDRLPLGNGPVADVLTRHAGDVGAGMMVMGGYGHSRLREFVFGGVTRSMLDRPPLPVFMAR